MAANEITLFNSSVSTVDGNASVNNDIENNANNEDMILARLNELRLWQESQRNALAESQLDQQKMLELEKQKLYALFGLSAETSLQDFAAQSTESSFGVDHNNQHQPQNTGNQIFKTPKTPDYNNALVERNSLELHSPSMNQLQKIIENLANRSPKRDVLHHQINDNANLPKRPYLKRGEGLKNRFKISPDTFRLDNLPKYKYARRMQKHAQSQQSSRKQRHQEIPTNDTITSTAGVGVAEYSEGQQNTANDDCIQNRSHGNDIRKVNETKKRPSPQTLQLKLKPNPTANKVKALPTNDVLHQNNQGK